MSPNDFKTESKSEVLVQHDGDLALSNDTSQVTKRAQIPRKKAKYNGQKNRPRLFNSFERDHIEDYLTYYKSAIDMVHFPESNEGDSDDDETIRASNRQVIHYETKPTCIQEHEFPALTREVLEKPYLSLPTTLNNKQRRSIYEICCHVGLYHSGAGAKYSNNRRCVVSVFPDGLDHVPDLEAAIDFPVQRCKAWYYRNDHNVECLARASQLSKGKIAANFNRSSSLGHFISRQQVKQASASAQENIKQLVKNPSLCLREFDSFDNFTKIPESDFSTRNMFFIDSCEKMRKCAKDLTASNIKELAFDLEAHNPCKYRQTTCLIQLCTNQRDEYVIDVLAPGVWDEVHLLQPIFADKNIVKIGHGVTGIDIPCLHRDFGIWIQNAFDTYVAAKALKMKKYLGLAKLCRYYNLEDTDNPSRYEQLKDLYQNSDWRARPLNTDMIEYGLSDVRYLIHLRHLLIRDLLKEAHGDLEMKLSNYRSTAAAEPYPKIEYETNVMAVVGGSQKCCLSLWGDKTESTIKNNTINELTKRADRLNSSSSFATKPRWSNCDVSLYNELVDWRNEAAKKHGVIPAMVCTIDLLALVAYKRPGSIPSLKRLNYFLPSLFREECFLSELETLFSIVAGAGGGDEMLGGDVIIKCYAETRATSSKNKIYIPELKTFQKDEPSSKNTELNSERKQPRNKRKLRSGTLTKIKWSAAAAAVTLFWISVAKRRR
jgi:ribonuclease D